MQRSSQFDGIKQLSSFIFLSSEKEQSIFNLIKERTDQIYNIYLSTEIFDIDNNMREEDKILEKISQVEFLQDFVEQYIKKKQYNIDLQENEYRWIALIYELCIKILQVVKNKLWVRSSWYSEHIKKWLIYNTLLCSIYYFCAKEIGMWQMIAEFFAQFDITVENIEEDGFIYMIKLIDFFSISRYNNVLDDSIIQLFNKFCVNVVLGDDLQFSSEQYTKLRDCIWPDISYLINWLNVLRQHSLKWYFSSHWWNDKFIGTENFTEDIRFLLPWQLEVLNIIDSNTNNNVKSNIVTMPTSAGKSLIAEIQIARHRKSFWDKHIVYIAPKVALCDQISEDLKKKFGDVIEDSIDWLFNDFIDIETIDHTKNIHVLTPEKFLLLLWRDFEWSWFLFEDISLIVFDEFHSIWSDTSRWPKMELLMNIIKLKKRDQNPNIEILLMSAMITNGSIILNRLGSEWWTVAESNKSPTRKHLFYTKSNQLIYSKSADSQLKKNFKNKTTVFYDHNFLVKLKTPEKIFIFRSQVSRYKTAFDKIKINFGNLDDPKLDLFSNLFSEPRHKEAIRKWIWFIYREMPSEQKSEMIKLFKSNELKVIIGNSTIIDGVNLDVEYLIIWDYTIFDQSSWRIKSIEDQDIHNMFWRAGRFPHQTDWFVFMNTYRDTEAKEKKTIEVVEKLYDNNYQIKSKSVEDEDILEQYFMIRLATINEEITDNNVNQIMASYEQELQKYFIWYELNNQYVQRSIHEVIKRLKRRDNFIKYKWYLSDRFYKITGMSPRDSSILLDKYDQLLKEYWSTVIREDSGYEIDMILPESFYPILVEWKEIKFSDRHQYNDYLMPWILNIYLWKLDNDIEIDKKEIMKEKIQSCILWIKYKVKSYKSLLIMRKYGLSPELSDILVEKWFTNRDIIWPTILQSLQSEELWENIKHEIEYRLLT